MCLCTRESSCVLCFFMGGITTEASKFRVVGVLHKMPHQPLPALQGFPHDSFCVRLTTTAYDFYGITDQVGCAILECGFQALPGQRVRLHRFYNTNSKRFEI